MFSCALALAGCASPVSGASTLDDGAFAAEPLMRVTSASGNLQVDVRTGPEQPPSRGNVSVEFTIVDALGAPASGLTLNVVPWMPAMGHGASVTPSVRESAPGTYAVTSVTLFMAGTWELRTAVSGPVTDSFAPSFQIP